MSDLQAKASAAPVKPAAAPAPAAQAAAAPATTAAPAATAAPARKRRAAKEAAELTRTENFQLKLQESMGKIIGEKIAKNTAWQLFKESFDTMVEFTSDDKDKKLPLAGIGRFEVRMSKPRKPVVRKGEAPKESKYAKLATIPHLRWKPSDRYRKYLLEKLCNFKEPEKAPVKK